MFGFYIVEFFGKYHGVYTLGIFNSIQPSPIGSFIIRNKCFVKNFSLSNQNDVVTKQCN